MTDNAALAAILDRRDAAGTEQLLGALVSGGVFVPTQANGSVMFLRGEDGEPVLPGYVSEVCCAELLPEAAAAVHCDALRLADIVAKTEVATLALFSRQGSARVPVPLLLRAMREQGRDAEGELIELSRSAHPAAVELRYAISEHIREFPAVRAVWIAHARWPDTGVESLLLHVAVDEEPKPSRSAKRLMALLLDGEEVLGEGDPAVSVVALNTRTHAEVIADLETRGLDTVRHDPATGQVEVISQEYDQAPAPAKKRWWQRRSR
ncbi:hypothetical protein JOF53_004455 [Crossiella equi]|uniref:SseB protein N-terminal domain-containing protein n=1 Tax=Crossiella equi TaxID=130796 RepID=A0ABS5AG73_9PSEU|nr:hypothetical protein [Crossiella equi]MBP2475583.1 hypothetical protein [Crossiella equi]